MATIETEFMAPGVTGQLSLPRGPAQRKRAQEMCGTTQHASSAVSTLRIGG